MAAAKPLPEAILDARIDVLKLQATAQRQAKEKSISDKVAPALEMAVAALQEAEQHLKA